MSGYVEVCGILYDNTWNPAIQEGVYSGCNTMMPGCYDPMWRNIYSASTSAYTLGPLDGLQVYGQPGDVIPRGILARYPNSDPEYIPVTIQGGTTWFPPLNPGCNGAVIEFDLPNNYPGMFQNYTIGVNGTCTGFLIDQDSYWCQPYGRTGGSQYCYRTPSGLSTTAMLPNSPYGNATGATVSAWRAGLLLSLYYKRNLMIYRWRVVQLVLASRCL